MTARSDIQDAPTAEQHMERGENQMIFRKLSDFVFYVVMIALLIHPQHWKAIKRGWDGEMTDKEIRTLRELVLG
jgi:hypothetical protein